MNPFASLVQPIAREEEMDAAELSPERYAKVLADLSRINALTLAPRPTLGFLERVRARGIGARPWRILDVGFGAGDMLARIARWGERRGIGLDLAGVDLNPKSEAVARARLGRRARGSNAEFMRRRLAKAPCRRATAGCWRRRQSSSRPASTAFGAFRASPPNGSEATP